MLKVVHRANWLSYICVGVLLASLFFISSLGTSGSVSAANPENVNYQVNVAPSLVVEVPTGNNVVLDLNPNSKTFDYKDLEVIVRTNNVTGYQLKLTTADNNTYLTRDTSVDAIPINAQMNTLTPTTPATTGYSESDFKNCLDTNTSCMNKWGYKVTSSDTDPSLVTTNYFPFTNNTTLATNHIATNGDSTTMRFAAKINYDQIAGSYQNTLVFTAVATYAAYTINYYDGVNNTSGNEIATQTNAYNTSASVPINPQYTGGATAPTRSGNAGSTYTFAGWCKSSDSNIPVNTTTEYNTSTKIYSNPATKCNGIPYQTGDILTIDPTEYSTNLTLYAYWTPTTFTDAGVTSSTTMQDSNISTICANVTPNQWTTLIDSRDNQSYHIIKLEDNKCWMADNLNLDIYNTTLANLQGKTNAGNTELNYLKNGGGTTSNQYPTSGINANSTYATSGNWINIYSYSDPLTHRGSTKCDGSINGSYQCLSPYQGTTYSTIQTLNVNLVGTPNSSSAGTAAVSYNLGVGNYQVGTYYNYCAASAGTYCWGSGTDAGSHTQSDGWNITSDICPTGWKLPRSGTTTSTNDYQTLYNTINANYASYNSSHTCTVPTVNSPYTSTATCSAQTATSPYSLQTFLSTPVSGDFARSSAHRMGTYGIFWSSSYSNVSNIYDLLVAGTGVAPQGSYGRGSGVTIRCVTYPN